MNSDPAPLKILIADDHDGMRRVIRRICAAPHREFLECGSGEEAVQAVLEHAPDWIIMDVKMPGMDGLRATREICRRDANARVIVISQYTAPEYIEQARSAGAIRFVGKEDLSQLIELIRGQSPRKP